MKGFVFSLGCLTSVSVVALLFANAYGCLIPREPVPYTVAMFTTFMVGIITVDLSTDMK